jgi:hypothetical protein
LSESAPPEALARPDARVRYFKGKLYGRPLFVWGVFAVLGALGFAFIPSDLSILALALGVGLSLGLSVARPWMRGRGSARLRLSEAAVGLDQQVLFSREELAGMVSARHWNCWMVTLFDVRGRELNIELPELEHGVLVRELGFQGLPTGSFELRTPMTWPMGAALLGTAAGAGLLLRLLAPNLLGGEKLPWIVLGLVIAAIALVVVHVFRREIRMGVAGVHVVTPVRRTMFPFDRTSLKATNHFVQILDGDEVVATFECASSRAATQVETARAQWMDRARAAKAPA